MSPQGHSPSARDYQQGGIALILVLWVLALISALAIAFAASTRTDLQIVRNDYETARARAAADGAVSLAIMGILDPSPQTKWHAGLGAHVLALPDANVRVSIEDEGGKVDLNAAPKDLLLGLFQAIGIDPATSNDLAESVIQRRHTPQTETTLPAPGVATTSNRPTTSFVDVSDLRLVPGMTRSLYDRIAPFVTVYSRSPRINPLTAPPAVLAGVPGLTQPEIQDFVVARSQPSAAGNATTLLGGGAQYLSDQPLQVITIRADATTENGARFVRKAVVALGTNRAPYRFLAWEQATTADLSTSPPAGNEKGNGSP